jgi:tetratricopeptide (TPR) repeat protein
MPEYIVSGRDPRGRKVTEWFEAASAVEAVHSFHELGYTDVVLHIDDVAALSLNRSKINKQFTPADYLAMRRGGGSFFFWVLWLYRRTWKTTALLLAFLAFRRVVSREWNWWDGVLLAIILSPIVMAAWLKLGGKGQGFRRMMEARSWGRWGQMLERLEPLQGKLSANEFAFRKAQGLAGLGRTDEAEAVVAPFAGGSAIPEWYYWARMTEVYGVAHRTDRVVEALETAARLAPENATVRIDLAIALVRYRRDTRRARALLDEARDLAISDLAEPLFRAAEGLVSLEEKDAGRAVDLLKGAIKGLWYYRPGNPYIGLVTDRLRGSLALAYAALGDRAAAEREFRRAEPRLVALGMDELLGRCRNAVGV